MVPIGVGVVWLAYTAGIWGYCLVRGYDCPFSSLFHSTWPGAVTGNKKPAVQPANNDTSPPARQQVTPSVSQQL